MTRGFGETAFVEQLPEVVTLLFGIVTQFGDIWFLTIGAIALYWFGRTRPTITADSRRDGAYAVALLLGAYGLTLLLKAFFALPRPPGAEDAVAPSWLPVVVGPVYESMVTGHGYGFPSGHALATTVVYGGLAMTLRMWNARKRALVAAGIVSLVALSRVVIGVHYAVDVIVGVAVGGAYLWAIDRVSVDRPHWSFAPPVAFGAIAYVTTGNPKAVAVLAVSFAGLLAWRATESRTASERVETSWFSSIKTLNERQR